MNQKQPYLVKWCSRPGEEDFSGLQYEDDTNIFQREDPNHGYPAYFSYSTYWKHLYETSFKYY